MSEKKDKERLKKAEEHDKLLRTRILENLSSTNEKGLLDFVLIFQKHFSVFKAYPYVDDINFYCSEGITGDLLLTDGDNRYLVIQFTYFENFLRKNKENRTRVLKMITQQEEFCISEVLYNKHIFAESVEFMIVTNEFRDFNDLEFLSLYKLYCQIVDDGNKRKIPTHEIIEQLLEEIYDHTIKSEYKKKIEKIKYVMTVHPWFVLLILSCLVVSTGIVLAFLPNLFDVGLSLIGISFILFFLTNRIVGFSFRKRL